MMSNMKYSKEEVFDLIKSEIEWAESEGFDQEVAQDGFIMIAREKLLISTDSALDLWNAYMGEVQC